MNRVFRTQFTDLCYGYNTELMFQELPSQELTPDFRGEQPVNAPGADCGPARRCRPKP